MHTALSRNDACALTVNTDVCASTSDTVVVLIHGRKRAGKDYLAGALTDMLTADGFTCRIASFAGPLKRIVATTLGISEVELDRLKNDPECVLTPCEPNREPGTGITYREILQRFGTDAMHTEFGTDVWVKHIQTIAALNTTDFLLVPDFRFPSEAISPVTVLVQNRALPDTDTHSSEHALDDFGFSFVVDNTGYPELTNTLTALSDHVKRFKTV